MVRLRRVEGIFEGPAPSVGGIVAAACLSFVIPVVFTVCPGFGSATFFDVGSFQKPSGGAKSVAVGSAAIFLTSGRSTAVGRGGGDRRADLFSGEVPGDVRKLVSAAAAFTGT